MQKQVIYVSSWPKSGSTWLTRLLADTLNSPSGGCMPSEDTKEIATEGQDRPGNYIVRKGHFVLIDDDTGPVVPRPHRLAWKQLTDERIVFLVRDPRDICISGAWHWRQKPEIFLDRMIKGDVARCGRWDEYCDKWLNALELIMPYYVSYEILTIDIEETVGLIANFIDGYGDWHKRLNEAIKRQSFQSRKAQIWSTHRSYRPTEPDRVDQEMRRNNMRKGIVGDWRNHFTSGMNIKIWSEFGWMMERLGYEK